MLGEISYWGAALAGLVAFFTPCILPMVPFYLSYMAGISMSELREEGEIAPGAQKRLVVSAFMFALGVTTIFMLLGLGQRRWGRPSHSGSSHCLMLRRRLSLCSGCISLASYGSAFYIARRGLRAKLTRQLSWARMSWGLRLALAGRLVLGRCLRRFCLWPVAWASFGRVPFCWPVSGWA